MSDVKGEHSAVQYQPLGQSQSYPSLQRSYSPSQEGYPTSQQNHPQPIVMQPTMAAQGKDN